MISVLFFFSKFEYICIWNATKPADVKLGIGPTGESSTYRRITIVICIFAEVFFLNSFDHLSDLKNKSTHF